MQEAGCPRALPTLGLSITRVAASLFPAVGKMHQQSPVLHRHGGRAGPVFLLLADAHGAHASAPALHQRLHHPPCGPQRPAVPVLLQEMQPVTRGPPATDTRCLPLGSAIPAPRMRTLLPDLPRAHNKGQSILSSKAGGSSRLRWLGCSEPGAEVGAGEWRGSPGFHTRSFSPPRETVLSASTGQ